MATNFFGRQMCWIGAVAMNLWCGHGVFVAGAFNTHSHRIQSNCNIAVNSLFSISLDFFLGHVDVAIYYRQNTYIAYIAYNPIHIWFREFVAIFYGWWMMVVVMCYWDCCYFFGKYGIVLRLILIGIKCLLTIFICLYNIFLYMYSMVVCAFGYENEK